MPKTDQHDQQKLHGSVRLPSEEEGWIGQQQRILSGLLRICQRPDILALEFKI